jgi:DNA polymerase V
MNYKPERSSMSLGEVLHEPYDYIKTKLIVKEMMDNLSLDLVEKKVVTNKLVLSIGYDVSNLIDPVISKKYFGEVVKDYYGRSVPKHAHGTINIDYRTSSNKILSKKIIELYNRIINRDLLVRRINIVACDIVDEKEQDKDVVIEQLDLFSNVDKVLDNEKEKMDAKEENKLQHAMIDIKKKYGKNAILRGMNFEDGGTARDRNKQVGGHSG